jgi:hypothetical protein
MKRLLLPLVFAATLLPCANVANAQVSIGIQIGSPPAPRAYAVPAQPGPGYEWVEGYWYPQGKHYVWHNGYWTRPPYAGAYWAAPYYDHGHYYGGRWEGSHGVVMHNHQWDHSARRDENREPHDGEHTRR